MKKFLFVPVLTLMLFVSNAYAASSAVFTKSLAYGTTSADVMRLQTVLADGGYLQVKPTGYYGSLTAAAVEALQKASGISPTYGKNVGPKTLAALNGTAATAAVPAEYIIPNSVPSVSVLPASIVTGTSATLNGAFPTPGNARNASAGFMYGSTTGYGSIVEKATVNGTSISTQVTGLTCNSTYHYAVFASNSFGGTNSADATFTTSACTNS